jgi:hypothetical protein
LSPSKHTCLTHPLLPLLLTCYCRCARAPQHNSPLQRPGWTVSHVVVVEDASGVGGPLQHGRRRSKSHPTEQHRQHDRQQHDQVSDQGQQVASSSWWGAFTVAAASWLVHTPLPHPCMHIAQQTLKLPPAAARCVGCNSDLCRLAVALDTGMQWDSMVSRSHGGCVGERSACASLLLAIRPPAGSQPPLLSAHGERCTGGGPWGEPMPLATPPQRVVMRPSVPVL